MNLYNETKFIMKQNNIIANKNLGQNFLINENVVDTIVDSAQIGKEDLIIEIGPGLGTLTSKLVEKAGKVICVEIDKKMIHILENRFQLYKNIEIINEDILKLNLEKIIKENKNEKIKKAKVVANLPYYITTPIIMKLLEERLDIESITVMIQKEVAERLVAKPGTNNSGSITYSIWYYTNPKIIMEVPKESFIPAPEVMSSVIQFSILKEPRIEIKNEKLFFKIIKVAFMQKRKTLINALVNGKILENKEQAKKCLDELEIDEKIRGEKLTLEQYKKITEYIEKMKINKE